MVTTQMKTDAQRLGNGKKAFNVKQVEKMVESKQDVLTAGENIIIENNVISASGGGSSGEWTFCNKTNWTEFIKSIDNTDNTISFNKELYLYFRGYGDYYGYLHLVPNLVYKNLIGATATGVKRTDNNNDVIYFNNINIIDLFTNTSSVVSNGYYWIRYNITTSHLDAASNPFTKITTDNVLNYDNIKLYVKQ